MQVHWRQDCATKFSPPSFLPLSLFLFSSLPLSPPLFLLSSFSFSSFYLHFLSSTFLLSLLPLLPHHSSLSLSSLFSLFLSLSSLFSLPHNSPERSPREMLLDLDATHNIFRNKYPRAKEEMEEGLQVPTYRHTSSLKHPTYRHTSSLKYPKWIVSYPEHVHFSSYI